MKDKVIEISDLVKKFDKNLIFDGFSMDLLQGETLVILGRSGVGKSVLLKCITGLLMPDSGNVIVLGEDLLNMKENQLNALRSRMGYLFQNGALYDSMTIKENLLFPIERNKYLKVNNVEENINNALESVGLLDSKNMMPSELSGGMKKRAGLARTLVMQPEIILYDEPTTGLDPSTAQGISELIVTVKEKHCNSSIVVTHDMNCAKIVADRIIVLDEGKSIAEGNYKELLYSDKEKVKEFFQS